MCGLAVVEGRTVNEEITINRLLSSRRVLNPTIIPALLTRPILSQIPDHNNELSCQTIFDIIRFYNLDQDLKYNPHGLYSAPSSAEFRTVLEVGGGGSIA